MSLVSVIEQKSLNGFSRKGEYLKSTNEQHFFLKVFLLSFLGILYMQTGFGQGFTVKNCNVDITLSTEGYFDVVENYDIDFSVRKHGVYRDILTRYDLVTGSGKKEVRNIDISNIEVPRDNYEVSRSGGIGEHKVSIKIGDANETILGPHHYEIHYRVKYAYLYEDSLVQFYWNIKPANWLASFLKIDFQIHVPDGIDISESDCFVYSGEQGNTSPATDFKTQYSGNTFSGRSADDFLSNPGQSVTVLVKLPSGSIAEIKPLFPFLTDYGWVLILLVLGGVFFWIWQKYGKDDLVPTTTSYYAPNDLDPAMAGFLINDKEDTSDLISLIPYWATNGLLKIEEIEKEGWFSKNDTKLIKVKEIDGDVPVYQRTIFHGLFGDGRYCFDKQPGKFILHENESCER